MDRFSWASNYINPQPNDVVLEIGCGTGTMAAIMAERLVKGRVLAIDRSASMISKANKKNLTLVKSGKLQFIHGDFSPGDFEINSFNKIVAFNVNIFQGKGEVPISDIGKLLKSNGRLFVFYQAPYKLKTLDLKKIEDLLIENQFSIEESKIENLLKSNAARLIAKYVG